MSLFVNIHKELRDYTLNLSFETEGEIMALLGASGSGKSAALRCIAGLERPDRGQIILNGRTLFDSAKHIDLPPQKRRVGFLHQRYALFPHMTVRQNLSAVVQKLSKGKQKDAVDTKLRVFRLEAQEGFYPAQLTAEQRQRAALARLLLSEPECFLLDDPFSGLDCHLRWQAELELTEMLRPLEGDVLLSTRDRDEVCRLCKTVCVISDGRNEEKSGVRDLMSVPRTVSAALITGCKNFSRVQRVDATHVKCLNWGVTMETTQQVNNICTYVGVREYDFHIARSGEPNRFDARVVRVIEGTSTVILLLAPDGGDAMIRMELSKRDWLAVRNNGAILLGVAPEHVMTLSGEL